ncbi:hypothetical protein GCM10007079_16410 [Nocardiopsis terrae]|nr:hypothetical protein GCM10007079_16410 [Nocardiopsis terrae]
MFVTPLVWITVVLWRRVPNPFPGGLTADGRRPDDGRAAAGAPDQLTAASEPPVILTSSV